MKAQFTIVLTVTAAFGVSVGLAQVASPPADDKAALAPPIATPQVTATPSPAGAGGMLIFIDPATGKIRQPDAADINELLQQRAQPQSTFVARPFVSSAPGGGIGVKLDESFHSYMVATKKPDGGLVMDCLPDAKKAADAVASGLNAGETVHRKESLDVQ
jgi:hypothetical protein